MAGSPTTYLGVMVNGFPNMLMVAGPQSVSGSTNYPRAIEVCVDWIAVVEMRTADLSRLEADVDAEAMDAGGYRHAGGHALQQGEKLVHRFNANVRQCRPALYCLLGGAPRTRKFSTVARKVSATSIWIRRYALYRVEIPSDRPKVALFQLRPNEQVSSPPKRRQTGANRQPLALV